MDDLLFVQSLKPLIKVIEAHGFQRDLEAIHLTWLRARPSDIAGAEDDAEKVVLWRHPMMPQLLQAYVASTAFPQALYFKYFDARWKPKQIAHGHRDKGYAFKDAVELEAHAHYLAEYIWPRVLKWFEDPKTPEEVLVQFRNDG